jgi:hypothetical protein
MQFYRSISPVLVFLMLFLAACAPVPLSPATGSPGSPSPEGPVNQPTRETPPAVPVGTPTRLPSGPTSDDDLPEAVQKAIETFSLSLGSTVGEVTVISYEEETFTDSCLGLGGPAEMCLQALTPGYLIHLEVDGKPYEVHTDRSGTNVRTKDMEGPIVVQPGAEQPVPVLAAMRALSESLGVQVGEIEVLSVEEVEWPNSCLGLAGPGEMCAEVITPGFVIILQAGGNEYEFHSDRTGENLRQN